MLYESRQRSAAMQTCMARGPQAPHLIHIYSCTLRVELAEIFPIIPNAAGQLHHTLSYQDTSLYSIPTSTSNFSEVWVRIGQGFICQISTMHAHAFQQQAKHTASGFTWQQSTGYTLRSGKRCSLPARALRKVVFPEPGGPSSRVILPCRPAKTPSEGGASAGCREVRPAAETKHPGRRIACHLYGSFSHTVKEALCKLCAVTCTDQRALCQGLRNKMWPCA